MLHIKTHSLLKQHHVPPSGLPLIFRQDNGKADAAGQFEEHELARSLSPLLFCYTDKEQPAM